MQWRAGDSLPGVPSEERVRQEGAERGQRVRIILPSEGRDRSPPQREVRRRAQSRGERSDNLAPPRARRELHADLRRRVVLDEPPHHARGVGRAQIRQRTPRSLSHRRVGVVRSGLCRAEAARVTKDGEPTKSRHPDVAVERSARREKHVGSA